MLAGQQVREFELVFTWDKLRGRVRVLFAHNFKLGDLGDGTTLGNNPVKEMYVTDFKVGKDSY